MKKNLLLFILSLLSNQYLQAFHLIGSQFTYQNVGGDNYELKIRVFRNCNDSLAALFDDPLYLAIYKSGNVLYQSYSIPFLMSDTITQLECSSYPFNTCVQQGEYDVTVNLPPVTGGYLAVYQRCCRNVNLTNIDVPTATGITAWIEINDSALAHHNSSPQVMNFPATDICLQQLYTFNYELEVDSTDSLSYHFMRPFAGADQNFPQPNPAPPPPYPLVTYVAPYNEQQPLGPASFTSLDSITGLLQVIPDAIGVYLVGIQIDQYRNNVLMTTVRSDFDFTVTEFDVGVQDVNGASSVKMINEVHDNLLMIENNSGKKISISIYDELGRKNFEQDYSDRNQQLNTSFLNPGIYFVQCVNEKGMTLLSQKIFIK